MAIISKESRKPIKKGRGEHTCGFSIHTNGLRSYSPSPNHVHLSFHYTGKIPKQANLSTRSIRLPPTRLHRILLPHPRTEPPPWSNKYSISSNPVLPLPSFVRILSIELLDRLESRIGFVGELWREFRIDRDANRRTRCDAKTN